MASRSWLLKTKTKYCIPVIDRSDTGIDSSYGNGAFRMDLAIGIGGAAGQGIATPGDILARILVRRGLHLNSYNAYQPIVRGGTDFFPRCTSMHPIQTSPPQSPTAS